MMLSVMKAFYKKLKRDNIRHRSYKSFSNAAFMVDIQNRIFQLTSKHNDLDFDISKTTLGIQ